MIRILLSICLTVWAASAALAETPQDRLLAALVADGYTIEQTERTWLGRLRIIAVKGDLRREVVINPGTGEVLRDIASAIQLDESNAGGSSAIADSGSDSTDTTSSTTGADTVVAPSVTESDGQIGVSSDVSLGTTRDLLLPEAGVKQ
jgi:hypothetical protein